MAVTISGSTGIDKVVDGSIATVDLADNAVATAKIANDAVTTDKLNLISTSSVPSLEARSDGTTDGYIQLNCSANSHGIKLKSPPHSAGASYTLTFPNNDGDANQFLQTNGSGVMSWAAAGAGTPTLLTTLNTTSGTELTTATLNLTTYKTIYVKITNIGQSTNTGSLLQWKNNGGAYQSIFNQPSDTAESGHAYIICKPAELIPNYYQWTSPYGTRGRDWNIAVGGGPSYKYTTAMMILPSTTSISFKWLGGQTFNLGQILIYGQT